MRQDERKGAWTLLIAVLVFGALVWGYGGKKFREDREAERQNQQTEMAVLEAPADSTALKGIGKSASDKATRNKPSSSKDRSSASSSRSSSSPSRDILADTIQRK